MSEKIIDKLIQIYASCHVTEVYKKQAYINLCKKYDEFGWFNEGVKKIIAIKKHLEEFVEGEIPKDQVSECLQILHSKIFHNRSQGFELTYKLIVLMYARHWSPEQMAYFNQMIDLFKNRNKDYFLSFTSRKVDEKLDNFLHTNYKFFIKQYLGIKTKKEWIHAIKEAEENNDNLLAKTINRILRQKLDGFYYPSYKGNNEVVAKKLKNGCQSSFSFIQLIQNIIFKPKENDTNYCYLEYKYAKEVLKENERFYILAEKSRDHIDQKYKIDDQYHSWYHDVMSRDILHLPPTEIYNGRQLQEMYYLISEKLRKDIEIIRTRLFNSVPN